MSKLEEVEDTLGLYLVSLVFIQGLIRFKVLQLLYDDSENSELSFQTEYNRSPCLT